MSVSLLHSFTGQPSNGANPYAGVIYEGGILYGTTEIGGTSNKGTLFSYNVGSNTLTTLYSFTGTGSDGKNPVAGVIYQSGILYGTAQGGSNNAGILFSYNLTSNTLATLHSFTGQPTGGANPFAEVMHKDGVLYGTTNVGGGSDLGTLFKYNLSTNTFSILHSFTGTGAQGKNPETSVIYQSGILYGTTGLGGSTNSGTLFSYDLTSNTLTTLCSLNGYPHAELIYQSGILYGTTDTGGSSNSGLLFSYNLTSNTLTSLHSFTGTDGLVPRAIIYQSGILYGITNLGGSSNKGTIFSYNLSSNTFSSFYSFTGQPSDGSTPYGVIYLNGILYGTTQDGGGSNKGTIFSYTPTPISNICFPAGTLISTDQGEISIEKIIPFENTINNKNIQAITKTISYDTYLVCFDKNALGNNYPNKKTTMSKHHKILYKGQMIEAYKFLGYFEKVKQVDYNREILYNVLMEKYENIIVNNIMCETLHPNNIIAKLYNSNYGEEYKNKIIYMMNESIHKNDIKSYKKIVKHISN